MRKAVTLITALGLILVAQSAFAVSANVRISQVYGNGNAAGSTYNQDFIEIINASNSPVDISGWAVEYASAAGSWGTSFVSGGQTFFNYVVFPQNTILQPCRYLLIGAASGTSGGVALPTPDFSIPTNLSGLNGNVGIFTQLNASTACASAVGLVDKMAYGTGACGEGTAVASATVTTAATRKNCGLQDTDNNANDFSNVAVAPHNAASGPSSCCLVVPTSPNSWGRMKSIYR